MRRLENGLDSAPERTTHKLGLSEPLPELLSRRKNMSCKLLILREASTEIEPVFMDFQSGAWYAVIAAAELSQRGVWWLRAAVPHRRRSFVRDEAAVGRDAET